MGICCNWKCEKPTTRNKIRCGHCRMRRIYLCIDCGMQHMEPRALRCKECYKINYDKIHRESVRKYQAKMRPRTTCKRCGQKIIAYKAKYCSRKCYLNDIRNDRKCVFCSSGLRGNQRILCGDKECSKQYHQAYDHANLKHRSEMRKLQKITR